MTKANRLKTNRSACPDARRARLDKHAANMRLRHAEERLKCSDKAAEAIEAKYTNNSQARRRAFRKLWAQIQADMETIKRKGETCD